MFEDMPVDELIRKVVELRREIFWFNTESEQSQKVIQAVCIVIWKKDASFPDMQTLRSFCNKAARLCRKAADRRTKHSDVLELSDSARDTLQGTSAITACETESHEAVLTEALKQLSRQDQELFSAWYDDHKAVADIAADLGITQKTCTKRIERMEKRLKTHLKRLY